MADKVSRSAALVAACRMLADEAAPEERIISDPFAHLVVDDAAIAAARADEPLQNTLRLRTRFIDDAIAAFVATHPATRVQVVLLGAGMDARAFRLHLPLDVYEVDFPSTLALKNALLTGHRPPTNRCCVALDLAASPFAPALRNAGLDPARPTIIVWEGVSFYLKTVDAEAVIEQAGELLAPGDQFVFDYAELPKLTSSAELQNTADIGSRLSDGGEALRSGLRDAHGTLTAHGFTVVDDSAIEDLRPRYGLALRPRHYPSRILLATKK